MGQSPDEIRRDIEQVRDNLGGTIDAIEDRVRPGRIVRRRTERIRSGFTSVREAVMGRADDVAGSTTATAQAASDRVAGAAGTVADRAQSAAGTVADRAQSAAETVADRAQGAAETVADQAQAAAGAVSEGVRQAPTTVARQTRGNPVAAGLVAFGAGLVVAYALPSTEPEQHAADRLRTELEPVKDRALEAVKEVGSQVQDVAQDAAQQVKDRAVHATEQVTDHAQTAADQVRQQATSAGEQVTQQAQDSVEEVAERARSAATGEDTSRQDLYERAQALNIPGRSQMSKEELRAAIDAHQRAITPR